MFLDWFARQRGLGPCHGELLFQSRQLGEEGLDDLRAAASMPAYDDLYPAHWANNDELERRHLELMLKIKKWPMNDKNEVDKDDRQKRRSDPLLFSLTATWC